MTTYPPLGTLKPAGARLWVVDGPAVIRRRMPISTRATVALLEAGGLWVHAPTGLCAGLQDELATLGPVTHLVVPNWTHTSFVAEWRAAYPQVQVWAVPGEGGQGPGIAFDHALHSDAVPWRAEISHVITYGSRRYREAVFFQRPSRSLIMADLIQNFETHRLPAWMRPLIWLAGTDDSGGQMPYLMRRSYRRAELAQAVEQMIDWVPRALLLCHGRSYEQNAVSELERAFKRLLHDRRWSRAVDEMERKTGENPPES